MTHDFEAVLQFWFGDDDPIGVQQGKWFQKSEPFDQDLRERFAGTYAAAVAGELDDWAQAPRSALARIVVLDQFSRNLFRGSPRTWAQDPVALAAARAAIAAGHDAALRPVERSFVYMPFMHAEDVAAQDECVALFERLAAAVPVDRREPFAGTLKYAVIHRDIVARFGRFPHRNAVLSRDSTPEEIEFLQGPNSSF